MCALHVAAEIQGDVVDLTNNLGTFSRQEPVVMPEIQPPTLDLGSALGSTGVNTGREVQKGSLLTEGERGICGARNRRNWRLELNNGLQHLRPIL